MARTDTPRLLAAGVAAGILFFAVTFVEIFARPGFDIARHAISVLSLGPRGWVMKAVFIVSGLLVLACALGLRRAAGRIAGPVLVALYGAGLVLAGLFDAPPGLGFPPGTAADQQPVMTTEAIVHSIAFMLAFGSLIIACFVFAFAMWRGASRGAAVLSALAGLAMPMLIQLGMAGTIATGVAFYLAAMLAWIWLGWIALRHR
ncbi:MAG: DUF998 domain-containing protein [Proteobacteria bacterium]|nr:DUF998 domain-containing protein [Pseudomonadota bacterium]